MRIRTNGEDADIGDGLTVAQLLVERNVKMPDMVTVELNGEILNRQEFDAIRVKEGDQVEFLYFMGGGSHGGRVRNRPWR